MHGFVIVMGGIVLDMSNDKERVWPQDCNVLTITPACFKECFERDVFKELTSASCLGRKLKVNKRWISLQSVLS